jgi:hypothetical protein
VILSDFDLTQAVELLRNEIWAQLGYTGTPSRSKAHAAAHAKGR